MAAQLAYTTYGTLNAARDNVVLIPTFYAGHHTDVELMMAPGRAIDPARYFVVVPNMLGNGLSSSPSNTPPPFDRAAFPHVTIHDNVVCQHRLVTEHLRHRADPARRRLLDGRAAGVSVGRAVPGHGATRSRRSAAPRAPHRTISSFSKG